MKALLQSLVKPYSKNEDKARREFILNVLLLAIVCLSGIAFIINLIKGLLALEIAMSALATFVPLAFFTGLFILSRKGFALLTSIIFLVLLFVSNSYTALAYGIDIPMALLVYALIIVMAGILVNTRFAALTALLTASFVLVVGYLQIDSVLAPRLYWRSEMLTRADIIMFSIIFGVITVVSWLSNREIEKSLARARRSEAELKHERDSLEITVEARTKELKEAQSERMVELYRFAEFGRLSSGLFHDLINPLQAVSLNIEKLRNKTDNEPVKDVSDYVDKAITSAKRLENLVVSVRKQLIRTEPAKQLFSLNDEIKYVIDVLSHKALKEQVKLNFEPQKPQREIKIYGDPIRLNQVILNLVANAIDSYSSMGEKADKKEVMISIDERGDKITLQVKDSGSGISEENINKIFEAFFTTKGSAGVGLGLSMTQRIVEKDFGGKITVSSKQGEGSIFTLELPSTNEKYQNRN